MEVDHLISAPIADHYKERPMVGFDAICDEGWYSRVELFADHCCYMRLDERRDGESTINF